MDPLFLQDVDEEDSSFSFGPHIPTKLTGGGDEKSFPTIHEVNESLATTETEISWGKSASEIYHWKPR